MALPLYPYQKEVLKMLLNAHYGPFGRHFNCRCVPINVNATFGKFAKGDKVSEVYKSSTDGSIPLSFTGRHLLQSEREAAHAAIAAGDFNTHGQRLSRVRAQLARRMSELEAKTTELERQNQNLKLGQSVRDRSFYEDGKRTGRDEALRNCSAAALVEQLKQRGMPEHLNIQFYTDAQLHAEVARRKRAKQEEQMGKRVDIVIIDDIHFTPGPREGDFTLEAYLRRRDGAPLRWPQHFGRVARSAPVPKPKRYRVHRKMKHPTSVAPWQSCEGDIFVDAYHTQHAINEAQAKYRQLNAGANPEAFYWTAFIDDPETR